VFEIAPAYLQVHRATKQLTVLKLLVQTVIATLCFSPAHNEQRFETSAAFTKAWSMRLYVNALDAAPRYALLEFCARLAVSGVSHLILLLLPLLLLPGLSGVLDRCWQVVCCC
jgi:hypothetical protein